MVSAAKVAPPTSVTAIIATSPSCRAAEQGAQLFVAALQRLFVQRLDPIGDLQHRGTARDQLFVEERVAILVPFFGGPGESAIQDFPVGLDFGSQRPKGRGFFGLERLRVAVQGRF